jgi:hypothetical protein
MKKISLFILLLSIIVLPALADDTTFSSPAGGEVWGRGTTHTITYTFSTPWEHNYQIVLLRNGVFVGYIAFFNYYFYAAKTYNQPWLVGKVEDEQGNEIWVPYGSGYTIGTKYYGMFGVSNPFTIGVNLTGLVRFKRIFFAIPPQPGGCPQCLILDLKALREELINLDEPVTVRLYWHGKMAANLGKIGKGQKFAAKLQVKLEPDALAAVKRGEEFELQVFTGRNQLLHSQSVRLMAAGPVRRNIEQIQKH